MPGKRLRLELLSPEELDQIEETSFRLLDEVGVSLQHAGATEMLHGLGCRVENGRVFIPRDVVRWGLEHVTPHKNFHSVDGSRSVALGDGAIRFHNGGGPPFALDIDTGERRPATMQDLIDMTRLLDALPCVDEIMPLFSPQDVPAALMGVSALATFLRNTNGTKPISAPAAENPQDVRYYVDMAVARCGSLEAFQRQPFMSIAVSPVSPLIFTDKVTSAIMAVVEAGAPFHALPAPSLGATGPITMAGALAQQHAEVLVAFLLAAAVRPGAPVIYCSRINPIDLRTAVSMWGGPEVGMAGAYATQLAHRHGFPCDAYGLCTSSGTLDPSYAYQRMANALVPALAGTDIMSGVGGLESGLTASLVAAVIDDEMIGLLKHVVKGIEVNPDTLAYDVMHDVILSGGVFLADMHTVRHMRRGAVWMSGVSDRAAGSGSDAHSGVIGRARERVQQILRQHEVTPLPEDVNRHLDEVVERARRELGAA